MSLDARIKRARFWINDLLHGGTIFKMYMDSRRVDSNFEYGQKWQEERIRDILNWAT